MAIQLEEIRELKKKKYRVVVEKERGQPRRTEVFCGSVKRALSTAKALALAYGPTVTGNLKVEGFLTAWSAEGVDQAQVPLRRNEDGRTGCSISEKGCIAECDPEG